MNRTVLTFFTILCLLSTTFLMGLTFNVQSVRATPKTWTVDDDGPADFHTIQEAINAASDGDIIFVRNGIYYEHVAVNKAVSLVGENRSSTIIDGENTRPVSISVSAEGAHIQKFTIRNSSGPYDPYEGGISITGSKNIVSDNIILNCQAGIVVVGNGNIVYRNNLTRSNWYGMLIWTAARNTTISGNSILDNNIGINSYTGAGMNNVTIIDNDILDNDLAGISIPYISMTFPSSNIFIMSNQIAGSLKGIDMARLHNSTIHGNRITDMGNYGIFLELSLNNSISENTIANNPYGIWIGHGSSYNNLSNNRLSDNGAAIRFDGCSYNHLYGNSIVGNGIGIDNMAGTDNVIFHNDFINNTGYQVYTQLTYSNIWDNGYPFGGNYWDDYNGTDLFSGPYQNETGYDWIGDTPYIINQDNQDNYPMILPTFVLEKEEIRKTIE